jgi:hypothetical protein
MQARDYQPRTLTREELPLVTPALRDFVEAQWAHGEEVPFEITSVDVNPITPEEEEWARQLVAAGR